MKRILQTALHSDKTYANQLKAGAILEKVAATQPEHGKMWILLNVQRLRAIITLVSFLAVLLFPAAAAAAPERPVIFIPGILGSKLCANNNVIWGHALSLRNFDKLEIHPGSTVNSIVPCGLVDSINLLGPFWTVHQYDDIVNTLKGLGYTDDKLFVFAYDWRQTNFDSAKALADFIERTPELRTVDFDLVAHSMGGIISRIYLQRLGGTRNVRKAIYLGTPFAGSMNALATLSNGWGAIGNQLAGGIETIRRVVLSFPAIYELLPSYDQCCRIGSETGFDLLNIYEFETWKKLNWLPTTYLSGAGEQAARANLARAKEVRDLMRQQVTKVSQVLVAGDAFATRLYLYAPKEDPSWKRWRFSKSRGDGTVPVWSAANSFGSLSGTLPAFSEHATIFTDQGVKSMLLRELVSAAPPTVTTFGALSRLTTKAGSKSIRLIDVSVEPNSVVPGGNVQVSVLIDFSEPVKRGDLILTAELIGPRGPVALEMRELSTDMEISAQRLSFSAKFVAPDHEGAWKINIAFPGQGQHAAYFETWR